MAAFWSEGEMKRHMRAKSAGGQGRCCHETLLPGAHDLREGLRLQCNGMSREEIVDTLLGMNVHSVSYFAWANDEDLPTRRGPVTKYYWRQLKVPGITDLLRDEVFVGRNFRELFPSSTQPYCIGFARLYDYVVYIHSPTEETVEPAEETVEPAEETVEPTEETVGPTEETVEPTAIHTETGDTDVRDQINDIKRLWDLHEQGALTADEFSVWKTKVIASVN